MARIAALLFLSVLRLLQPLLPRMPRTTFGLPTWPRVHIPCLEPRLSLSKASPLSRLRRGTHRLSRPWRLCWGTLFVSTTLLSRLQCPTSTTRQWDSSLN